MIRAWLVALRDVGKPDSDDWLRGMAALCLMSNDTVEIYDFVDGAEINRRTANPLKRINWDNFKREIQQAVARHRGRSSANSAIG